MEVATPLNFGIDFVGVSLAFGLTVRIRAYGLRHWPDLHLPFESRRLGRADGRRSLQQKELQRFVIA